MLIFNPEKIKIMERRSFIKAGTLTSASVLVSGSLQARDNPKKNATPAPFKLNYAPHFGMFKNNAPKGIQDELKFMADNGFKSIEDNGMPGRSVSDQELIGSTLQKLGMSMGVFVVNGDTAWKPSLTTGDTGLKDQFLTACKNAVEVAKRVNAKWMTVVPGFYQRNLPIGIQTANVIDCLRRASEIFEPHGLVMVLEPLSDTPDLFLRHSDQTYMICKAVKSPACKILFDIYHMQKNEGMVIPNIDLTWDEIAYIQIGDNPGRNEPGTGEVNYKNIFKHIYNKGYKGILGMEHRNSKQGKEGEMAVIEAYRQADSF